MMPITGDILMYRSLPTSTLVPRVIGAVQLIGKVGVGPTIYYHMGLAKGGNLQVEATWPRVRVSRFDPSSNDIEVWRVVGATPEQCVAAVADASAHVGEFYDLGEAAFGLFRSKHMEICTRLIDDSWMAAGVEIVPESKAIIYPDVMVMSKMIVRVA